MTGPLSYEQERLWELDRELPGRTDHVVTWAWEFTGPFSTDAMHRALEHLSDRHDVLRTEVHADDGRPVAVTLPPGAPVSFRVLDADGRRLDDRVRDELARPFDLGRAPLWRVLAVRYRPDRHDLAFCWHHIVIDAWSATILVRELGALYRAALDGVPAGLPALTARHADLAREQRERPDDEDVADQLGYWREQLAGAAPLRLPADRPRTGVPATDGASVAFAVPATVTGRLDALARARGATMFMVLFGATVAVLGRHAGTADVTVGTPLSARPSVDSESLFGNFLTMLVLRVDLAGSPTFADLLGRVRATTLSGYEFGGLPHARMRTELGLPDLLAAVVIVNNVEPDDWELPGLTVVDHPLPEGPARHEITVAFDRTAGELAGHVRYRNDLFDRARMEALAGDLVALLTAVAVDPSTVP